MKRKVDSLLTGNATLVEKANTLLRKGKSFVTLAKPDGSLTPAGKYYEQATGKTLEKAAMICDKSQCGKAIPSMSHYDPAKKSKHAYSTQSVTSTDSLSKAISFTSNCDATMLFKYLLRSLAKD